MFREIKVKEVEKEKKEEKKEKFKSISPETDTTFEEAKAFWDNMFQLNGLG
jgi:hypothetical protein